MRDRLVSFLDNLPLVYVVLFALTLGLAPFTPVPHVWEKLGVLVAGLLTKPLDIFDLALHGAPWLLLAMKLARIARRSRAS
jgi:hypothetical protein